VTLRGNRHQTSSEGWIHDQDNAKIIREKGEKDVILSYEKGYNTYTRVNEEKCISAKKWWDKNKNKWEKVRSKWVNIYDRKTDLTLKKNNNGKPLFMFLFDEKVNNEKEINSTIESFIVY
jgi:predicted lipoprotein with Yx(FWY)xxD motif